MPDTTTGPAITPQTALNRIAQNVDDLDPEFDAVQTALDELVQLRARVAELEAEREQGEVTTEWAAKYYDEWTGHAWTIEGAARDWLSKRGATAAFRLFRSTVRRGPWVPVDGEARDA